MLQGKLGAYSHIACQTAHPKMEPLPCPTFADAFHAVETGRADLAMIPIDNLIAGRVADIHHLLPRSNLSIISELFIPIHHCLDGTSGCKNRRYQDRLQSRPRPAPMPQNYRGA